MIKFYTTFLLFISFSVFSQQNDAPNYKIAILPVTTSGYFDNTFRENVRESITKLFAQKSRFTVVDRTKLDAVVKERNLQKQEDYLNGYIAEQGKSMGAQYLVSGNISTFNTRSVSIPKSQIVQDPYTKKYSTRNFTVQGTVVDLSINVELIDVSTSQVKSSRLFSQSLQYENINPQECINSTLQKIEGNMKAWINEVFPVDMKILKIEAFTKKGLPEKVLVKGGSDTDLEHGKGNLMHWSGSRSKLEVYENEEIDVDGKKITHQVKVGELKADEVEGELTVCKVTDGAEAIKRKMDEGKTLFIKIEKY